LLHSPCTAARYDQREGEGVCWQDQEAGVTVVDP
jgi:hypothetical protein